MARRALRAVIRVAIPFVLGAAVATALTLFLYSQHAESQYKAGSGLYVQLKETVHKFQPIQAKHLTTVRIPRALLDAFRLTVKAQDADVILIGRRARRTMYAGEFPFYADFLGGNDAVLPIPKDYEVVTLPIRSENTTGAVPSRGVYHVYGDFDVGPNEESENIEVMRVITAMSYVPFRDERVRPPHHAIRLAVPGEQALQLLQIQQHLKSGAFTCTLAHWSAPEPPEPRINEEVLRLLEQRR